MKNTCFRKFLAALLSITMTVTSLTMPVLAEEPDAPSCVHETIVTRVEAGAAPTCTADGSHTVVMVCESCGRELARTEVADAALGHAYGAASTAPTCTEAGKVTYTCARCGDTYTEAGEPALGHDDRETARTEAACGQPGSVTYTCSRCGASHTEALAALAHDYRKASVDPTCTEAGSVTYTCAYCGDTFTEAGEPALGHTYQETARTEPACGQPGSVTYTCSRCGASHTEALAALAHDYEETASEPTCTEAGKTVYTCARCGDSYTEEGEPALGHDYKETARTEATYDAEGSVTYTCSHCGDSHTDILPKPEKPAVPFEQAVSLDGVKITVTAAAGVLDADARLSISRTGSSDFAGAAEAVLGLEAGDRIIIRHAVYSFSGAEMNGSAQVKLEKLGLSDLAAAYPDGALSVYVLRCDADARKAEDKARRVSADVKAERNSVSFTLTAPGMYDVVTVVRLPEQAAEPSGDEDQGEPEGDEDETPADDQQDGPADDEQNDPEGSEDEAPEDGRQDGPADEDQGDPEGSEDETPADGQQDGPAVEEQNDPEGSEDEAPADGQQDDPADEEQGEPEGSEDETPADGQQDDPADEDQGEPEGGEDEAPVDGQQDDPADEEQGEPEGSEDEAPVDGRQDGPADEDQGEPEGSEDEAPADGQQDGAADEDQGEHESGEDETPTDDPEAAPGSESEVSDGQPAMMLRGTASGNETHTYGDPVWNWSEDYQAAAAVFTCTDEGCGHTETITDAEPLYSGINATAMVRFNDESYETTIVRPQVRLQVHGVNSTYKEGSYGVVIPTGTVTIEVNGQLRDYEGTQADYSYITIRAGDLVTVNRLVNESNDAYIKDYYVTAHFPNSSQTISQDRMFHAMYPIGNTGLIANDVYVIFDIHTHTVTLENNGTYSYDYNSIDPQKTGTKFRIEVRPSNTSNYTVAGLNVTYVKDGNTITIPGEPVEYQDSVLGTAYYFTMPPADAVITADVRAKHSVTCAAAENGTISASPARAMEGETITLTATPASGCALTGMSYTAGDGESTPILPDDEGRYMFTMPDADVTVSVTFASAWQALQQQIDAAEDGAVIRLTADATADADDSAIVIPLGKEITIQLNGHKIDRHMSSPKVEGYVILVQGDLTITGSGTITGGKNTGLGGGIFVWEGRLTLNGGTITGNSAAWGGGIALLNNELTMTDGSVTGNSSSNDGGGIYVDAGTFRMTGGSITGNAAARNGGGVAADDSVSGPMSIGTGSKITITGNTVNGDANNVYLLTGQQVSVTNEPAAGTQIGIFTQKAPVKGAGGGIPFAAAAHDWSEYFISDRNDKNYEIEWAGQVMELVVPDAIETWTELQYALTDGGTRDLTMEEDTWFIRLGADIVAGSGDRPLNYRYSDHPVILDLRGHDINRGRSAAASEGHVLEIEGGTLTIIDSVGGGRITGGWSYDCGGIRVSGGSLVMRAGSVTGNRAAVNGGGVYISSGSFTLAGGSVTGNACDGMGGGVYISDGSVTLTDGSVTGNASEGRGGGIYVESGALKLSGRPTVTGNTVGTLASNVFLYRGNVISLVGALSASASIGIGAGDAGRFTDDSYLTHHTGTEPGTFFTADSGFHLYQDTDGYPCVESADHTPADAPVWTWSDDGTSATLALSCVRCGEAIWSETAAVGEPELMIVDYQPRLLFTASVTVDGETYTDHFIMAPAYVDQTAPSINEDGRYVPGMESHYELAWNGQTHYYVRSSDPGQPFDETTPDALALSWFEFSGSAILRYTGPFTPGETNAIALPLYAPEGDSPLNRIGDGSFRFIEPHGIPAGTAFAITDRGNITAVSEYAFAGLNDLTLTLGAESAVTVGNSAFDSCENAAVLCNHASGLAMGAHDDAMGRFTVEFMDAHEYYAKDAHIEDDYSAATLTLGCDHGCAYETAVDAEIILEADADPDNPNGFLVTVRAVYEEQEYSLTTRVGSLRVTLEYNVNTAQQFEILVPKAVGKDCAVFTFSSLDLSGMQMPAGASLVGWTDGTKTYAAEDTVTILTDASFSAEWASTWGAVREALTADGACVFLYNNIQAGPDDLPLVVPAGQEARLILRGYDVDRGLTAAADDGCAIRADGTLYINSNPALNETYTGGTVKGGKNTGSGGGIYVGGALYAQSMAVSGNASGTNGGGIYIASGATAELTSVTVSGNTAAKAAGGVFTSGALTGTGLTVTGNNAVNGAGMYINGSQVTLGASRVNSNTATGDGGGVFVSGQLNASGTHFDYNTTSLNGGGIFIADDKTTALDGCWIEHNRASQKGGGVLVGGAEPQGIDDNTQPQQNGARLYSNGPSFTLSTAGTSIQYNSSAQAGGIFVENGTVQFGNGDKIINNRNLNGDKFDNLDMGNNCSDSAPFKVSDLIDTLQIGVKVGGWASGIGGIGSFFGGLFGWVGTLIEVLAVIGIGIGITVIIDSACNGDDDKQDKPCEHPKDQWSSDSKWEDDHYAWVHEITVCKKCNKKLSDSKLVPQISEDDSSKVTTYSVTLPDGKKDQREVQPYTVILKPGIPSLEDRDILEIFRIAHRRHAAADFTLPVASPWVIEGYQLKAWHLIDTTDSITQVAFDGDHDDTETKTVVGDWKVSITYESGVFKSLENVTLVGESPLQPNPSWVEAGPPHTLLECTWQQYVLFSDGDLNGIAQYYVFDGWDVYVGSSFVDKMLTPYYILEATTGLPGRMPGQQTEPVVCPIKVCARWRSEWSLLGTELNKIQVFQLPKNIYALQLDSGITIEHGAELDLNGYKAHAHLLSAVRTVFTVNDNVTFVVKDTSDSKNGRISGGKSLGKAGGVSVSSGGTFVLEGGSIYDNVTVSPSTSGDGGPISTDGGGVYVEGTFLMKGGSVKKNEGYGSGGGVFIAPGGTFRMTGGEIRNNSARGILIHETSITGGGVYVGGTFEVSGKVVIKDNELTHTEGNEITKTNNVYLPEGKTISVVGKLDAGACIGVSMAQPGVITSGLNANGGSSARGSADNFVSDRKDYKVVINADGEAELVQAETVVFDKGDENARDRDDQGNELMPAVGVPFNTDYELPECRFGAPPQKRFKEWSVKIGDDDPEIKNPHEKINIRDYTTVTAVWEDNPDPAFRGHAILLTGQIGLQFFLELPTGKTAADYPDSYVTFEGNKADAEKQYPLPETTFGTSGRYLFQLDLSSIQMADVFTPTFHYTADGEEKTVTGDAYAIKSYIDWALADGSSSLNARQKKIIPKLADYGHYAQPYLARYNGWVVGTDYAEMTTYVTQDYDYDAVRAAASGSAYSRTEDSADVTDVNYRLTLGSQITLTVRIKPAAGVTFSKITVDGAAKTAKKSGGYYMVSFPGIYANQLADMHTIVAGDCTINVSPMSYVYEMLGRDTTLEDLKNMLCALYNYAQACK